jgi:MinD superfamily P-loop ATPase
MTIMNIVVASGKGGTGKTFFSTNLFYSFRKMGILSSLVDCDAEAPNSFIFFSVKKIKEEVISEYRPVLDRSRCVMCGKCFEYCSYNAIFFLPAMNKIQLLDDLCHGCAACSVACTHSAIRDSYKFIGKVTSYRTDEYGLCMFEAKMTPGVSSAVPVIKSAIKTAIKSSLQQDINYVILDSPPGTACPFIQTASCADYVILVTEPTPFGLSDLKQAVETLKTMNKEMGVIVNRAGIGNREVYQYLEDESIPLLGEIPFDKEIAMRYSEGKIAVKEIPSLQVMFENIVNRIMRYGNSSN